MLVQTNVSLAPLTTLRLGGPAARIVTIDRLSEARDALCEVRRKGAGFFVLGGGSNVVVADEGFAGTVVRIGASSFGMSRKGDRVLVDAEAGVDWDALVEATAAEGLRGIECLAGIPGTVGATPIQNVGAYGQEVSQTLVGVTVFDTEVERVVFLPKEDCGLSYRNSRFKNDSRFVVLSVRFALVESADAAPIQYDELARALSVARGETAPLETVRQTVIALRRTKGMVIDPSDPETVSAGSFFTNPVVPEAEADAVQARARELGIDDAEAMPRFAGGEGRIKIPAAWLVERAGFPKGYGDGPVGISRKHALSLVHRGGGSTRELLDLARRVRDGVQLAFGVTLVPEPVLVGVVF